jgi:tRNA G26 N,N-dimethylase Trm1
VVTSVPLNPVALVGALVVVAMDDRLLLHDTVGEIPFYNPVDMGARNVVVPCRDSRKNREFRQMETCSACGERYLPEDREAHLANDCFPQNIHLGQQNISQKSGQSAGEKWRLMKNSSLTPKERAALGLFSKPNRRRAWKSGNNSKK